MSFAVRHVWGWGGVGGLRPNFLPSSFRGVSVSTLSGSLYRPCLSVNILRQPGHQRPHCGAPTVCFCCCKLTVSAEELPELLIIHVFAKVLDVDIGELPGPRTQLLLSLFARFEAADKPAMTKHSVLQHTNVRRILKYCS